MQGRGLEGFYAKRMQDSRNGLYDFNYFYRLFPYTGALFQSDLYQSNGTTLISRLQNSWSVHSFGSSPETRSLPYVNQSTAYRYEVGGTYDGVLLSTAVTTNVVNAATGTLSDSTRTTTEASTANGLQAGAQHVQRLYHSTLFNDFTNWCFGRPQVTQAINSHTAAGGASITRTSNMTWDGPACRPTQSVIESGNALWQVTTDYDYDVFGNVDAMTVTPASGQGQSARSNFIYWGPTGQFPATVTNAKGQVTSLGWDFAMGLRTSVTDPNLLQVSWMYDGFGRLTREQRPDSTATDYVIGACNVANSYCGVADLRSSVQIVARDTVNNAIRTDWQYLDAFDRPRYNDQQMLSGGSSTVIKNYDALGRVASQSAPFTSGDPTWYTSYTYDVLNRPTAIQRQTSESDPSTSLTQMAYQGLRTVTTDPLSRSSAAVYSALGQVVQVLDAATSDTDYEYDAFGNLLKTRDFYGNEVTLTYNIRGMKMSSSDPDMGAWNYHYFPLGELKTQTNAKSQTVNFTYDALSRPLTRVGPEGTTTWVWDTATVKGIGQLASVTSPGGYSESYLYDSLGRPSQTSITADATTYQYNSAYYASTGLQETLTYPLSTSGVRFQVRYAYQYGLMQSVSDYTGGVAGTIYWQAAATNARGQIVDEQYGNGLRTISGYDRLAGWLDDRTTGPSGGGAIQDLTYSWNKVGSLVQRQDLNQSLTENFYYDTLERLDYSTRNGVTNLDVAYDAIGNITSKSDVGTYAYHATRKHAVVSTTGTINRTYGYDADGNMTNRNGATTTWFSYDLPNKIIEGSSWSQFSYGANRNRWKQQVNNAGNVETWTYIGSLFEKRVVGPNTEYLHKIVGGNGAVGYYKRKSGGAVSTYYVTSDHLGSTNVITNALGAVLVNESFDAFGKRRGSSWSGSPTAGDMTQIAATTRRGFTFHEHLDNIGLVHMNGRVYDPVIGRFTSADPFAQAPDSSQSSNRYSYTSNSPLSYSDPSGFMMEEVTVTATVWNGGYGGGQPSAAYPAISANQNGPLPPEIEQSIDEVISVAARIKNLTSAVAPSANPTGTGSAVGRMGNDGALPPQQDPKGKCWNGSLGIGAVVHGPVAGPVGIGVSGGPSVGFSYGGSLLDSRFFFQAQAAGMIGGGVFGGVGVSAQGGAGGVPFGVNTAISWHSELNLGVGVGGSAVLDVLPDGDVAGGGFHGRIPGGRIGVAVGAAAGTGVGTATTIGSPTVREMLQALSLLPDANSNLSGCN